MAKIIVTPKHRAQTRKLRYTPEFAGVAKFASETPLYRVVDEEEWGHILRSGKVTGGDWAHTTEAEWGASWGADKQEVVRFGLNWRKGKRLKGDLFVLEADARGKDFLNFSVTYDFDGVPDDEHPWKRQDDAEVRVDFDLRHCSTGHGCSVKIDRREISTVYLVQPDGKLKQIPPAGIQHYLKWKEANGILGTPDKWDQFKQARRVSAALRAASAALSASDSFNIDWYPLLKRMVEGESTMLWHGTTADFKRFDPKRSRKELVDQYYGPGIFLTPEEKVARAYAHADRNIGFPPSVISDLKRVNPKAAAFMRSLYQKGKAAWDPFLEGYMNPEAGLDYEEMDRDLKGVDPNDIADVAEWIIGTKLKKERREDPVNIFSTDTGMSDYLYDQLDDMGVDGDKYRPKVYTVKVAPLENVLVTSSKQQARRAKRDGYDAVIFHGDDLVHGIPEVAVFDPRKVKILRRDVD